MTVTLTTVPTFVNATDLIGYVGGMNDRIDIINEMLRLLNINSGGGGVPVTTYTYSQPANGATVTTVGTDVAIIIDPLTALASLTIRLMAAPVDGQTVFIVFSQSITTLMLDGNGKTIIGAPVAVTQSGSLNVIYRSALNTWFVAANVAPGSQGRTILSADTSFYVSTTGSDTTGDGSSANPWATLQFADTFLRERLDFNGFQINLIIQTAGTYVGIANGGGYTGGGFLVIQGATNTPASYIVTDDGSVAGACFWFDKDTGTFIRIQALTFKPQTIACDCVWVNARINCVVGGIWFDGITDAIKVDFSNCSAVSGGNGFAASSTGRLSIISSAAAVTVPPGGRVINFFYLCSGVFEGTQGNSYMSPTCTWTFSGAIVVGALNGFAVADTYSVIVVTDTYGGVSASGGPRFYIDIGGAIYGSGGDLSYFPGGSAGVLLTGFYS